MEKELPLFPLNIVVYPEEDLNLHIFEDRYKQLTEDCLVEDKTFGIPTFLGNKIELGTEVKIVEVFKKYQDGRMDIRTKGLNVFNIVDYQNPWNEKLYAGGTVEILEQDGREDRELKVRFVDLSQQLFGWLKMSDQMRVDYNTTVYDIAHKIGLKLDEEYMLLKMQTENERLKFVIEHLKNIIPALERAEEAKERIRMNGHFKHLDPLKF